MSGPSEVAASAIAMAEDAERRADNAEANTVNVIEQASAAINAANDQAAAIAEAAMQTEIGRRMSALEQEFRTWQDRNDPRLSLLETLQTRLSTLEGQISALATVQVLAPMVSSQSTLPALTAEAEQATETIAEILPQSVAAVVESPAPLTPEKRKTRYL